MATSDAILFGSVFTVRTVDKDGKKFEKGAGRARWAGGTA